MVDVQELRPTNHNTHTHHPPSGWYGFVRTILETTSRNLQRSSGKSASPWDPPSASQGLSFCSLLMGLGGGNLRTQLSEDGEQLGHHVCACYVQEKEKVGNPKERATQINPRTSILGLSPSLGSQATGMNYLMSPEDYVFRQVHHCVGIIACTDTNLDGADQ